ncbi:MAG: hypothetical protein GX230_00765 [Lentisphaerae bacterium]|jgi:hypothetical protein|nr:hypothetical protein [Lentisphaerota bacterium]
MSDKAIIERYFQLRLKLNDLNDEIESIKSDVVEALRAQNGFARFDGFDLTLRNYKQWQYSEKVNTMQTNLTNLKREERQSGVALVRAESDMLVLSAQRAAYDVFEPQATYDADWEPNDNE